MIVNLLRSSRESLTLDGVVAPQAFMQHFDALPGDVWTISVSEYGIAAKPFLVQSIRKNFDGTASVSLKEDVAGTYADTLLLPELQERALEFGGEGEVAVPKVPAPTGTPGVTAGACVVHQVDAYPPENAFGKDGDRAYDNRGLYGLRSNGAWQPFSGRWSLAGQPCYVQNYSSAEDLPDPPRLTDPQQQALRRGGAYVGVIDRTHEVYSWSPQRGRWIFLMNICEQTSSPGLNPGIPCVLCYRFVEDWGSAALFPFLDAAAAIESGILYAKRGLTVQQVGSGSGQSAAERAMGDVPNASGGAFGNGYWIWSPNVTAATDQDPDATPILGTNTSIAALGYDYRGGFNGSETRERSRFFVDLAQIDPAGASKDWTEAQRDDYAFLLTDDAGNWILWRNLDYRDVEPFRGANERDATSSWDSEQGSILAFFKGARDNGRTVSVHVIDTRKVFIGLALRMGWDVPSFGSFTGLRDLVRGRDANAGRKRPQHRLPDRRADRMGFR